MAIIVDPSAGQTAPPTTVTSPDGLLTCTVKPYGLGVLLEYDGGEKLTNRGFESGLSPWTVSGGTAVVSSAQAHGGAQSAEVTPDGVSAQNYFESDKHPVTAGESYHGAGWAWFTEAVTANFSMSVNWFDSSGVYLSTSGSQVSVSAGVWTLVENTFTAPTGSASATLVPTLSGTPPSTNVWYVDDMSLAPSAIPTRVRFTRSDGEAVRSGDVALAPGGYAIAYDHEPPVGESVSYTATPVDTATDPSSAGVQIGQPIDSTGLEGLWLKNVDDPGQSLVGEVVDWDDLQYSTRTASATVLGKGYPIVTVDAVSSPRTTVMLRTRGREGFRKMAELMGLPGYAVDEVPSVSLLDPHSLLMRPRSYCVVTSVTPAQEGPVQLEQWVWSLEYQTVSRPDPTGARLRIPGRSYASIAQIYTQYSDIPQSNADYVQLATG